MPNGSKWLARLREKTISIESGNKIPPDWSYDFEERAAIIEYEGGLSRDEAEVLALVEINNRLKTQRLGSHIDRKYRLMAGENIN